MGLSPEKDEGSDCAEYTDGYVVDYHECGVSLRIPIDE